MHDRGFIGTIGIHIGHIGIAVGIDPQGCVFHIPRALRECPDIYPGTILVLKDPNVQCGLIVNGHNRIMATESDAGPFRLIGRNGSAPHRDPIGPIEHLDVCLGARFIDQVGYAIIDLQGLRAKISAGNGASDLYPINPVEFPDWTDTCSIGEIKRACRGVDRQRGIGGAVGNGNGSSNGDPIASIPLHDVFGPAAPKR